MRRTKVVCTIGPACDSEEMLTRLIKAGMNVARVNFSHGDADYHRLLIRRIRALRERLEVPVAILQDLQGPKIRVGIIPKGKVWLARGTIFVLTSGRIPEGMVGATVALKNFHEEVEVGHRVLLADGMIELVVESIEAPAVVCRVAVDGVLSSHKGVNLPSSSLATESMTDKDRHDLEIGLQEGVDAIALSFVRSEKDIEVLRGAVQGAIVSIIAKIEKPQAVENIDRIIEAADGVMIARGDLGLEIDLARLPIVQKMIIRKANAAAKPVITATQMLIQMVNNPRPTRAETADVANAILDGTDAVMLSEETAVGNYPVQAVEMMDRIAVEVESSVDEGQFRWDIEGRTTVNDAISRSAYNIARGTQAQLIITPTWSGSTARLVARFRPRQPIVATTPNSAAVYFLCFCWGIVPLSIPSVDSTEEQLRFAVDAARSAGWVQAGDLVVITGGTPLHVPGTTNFINIERVTPVGRTGQDGNAA